jgi:hypothetical protein
MTTLYVLMEKEKNEGGDVLGVYSSEEKAHEEAPKPWSVFYHEVVTVTLDAGPSDSWPATVVKPAG